MVDTLNGNKEECETNETSSQDFVGEFVECNEDMEQEMREEVQNPDGDDQLNDLSEQVTIEPEISEYLGKEIRTFRKYESYP